MIELRDYQSAAIDALRQHIRAGIRRLLLVSGTGTGKTVIAAHIIDGARQRDRHILFLAHRRELIEQTSRRLDAIEVDHGIMQAAHWRTRPWLPVQVASIATLVNRQLPQEPDLIIIDECHRARAMSYLKILERYPQAVTLGLTATPIRSDGKGLGALFDIMVQCPSVREMIAAGYLVPIRAWTQPELDLRGVGRTGGDYALDELAQRMNQAQLVGDILAHWRKLASDRRTVVFAVNIEHSKTITRQFTAAGIMAEHLDGTTPERERDAILARLASGETQIVVNCQVLTEGWDCPPVSAVVLARPTLSMGLYLQMSGRALRPHPGKADCLILDHAGCIRQHGLVDDDREWELTEDRLFKRKSVSTAPTFKVCPDCYAVARLDVRVCVCGYEFSKQRRQTKHKDGELVEVTSVETTEAQQNQRRRQYEYFLWQQANGRRKNGEPFKPGYAAVRFKAQFGVWPSRTWKRDWESKQEEREIA